jgi:hypothetical protein
MLKNVNEKNIVLGAGNLSMFHTDDFTNSQSEFCRFDPELSDFDWFNLSLRKANLNAVKKIRDELGETDTTTNLLRFRHNHFFTEGRTSCPTLNHSVRFCVSKHI